MGPPRNRRESKEKRNEREGAQGKRARLRCSPTTRLVDAGLSGQESREDDAKADKAEHKMRFGWHAPRCACVTPRGALYHWDIAVSHPVYRTHGRAFLRR